MKRGCSGLQRAADSRPLLLRALPPAQDTLVLSGVIAGCTVFLIIYVFSGK
jgi:hypothetical protein